MIPIWPLIYEYVSINVRVNVKRGNHDNRIISETNVIPVTGWESPKPRSQIQSNWQYMLLNYLYGKMCQRAEWTTPIETKINNQ